MITLIALALLALIVLLLITKRLDPISAFVAAIVLIFIWMIVTGRHAT